MTDKEINKMIRDIRMRRSMMNEDEFEYDGGPWSEEAKQRYRERRKQLAKGVSSAVKSVKDFGSRVKDKITGNEKKQIEAQAAQNRELNRLRSRYNGFNHNNGPVGDFTAKLAMQYGEENIDKLLGHIKEMQDNGGLHPMQTPAEALHGMLTGKQQVFRGSQNALYPGTPAGREKNPELQDKLNAESYARSGRVNNAWKNYVNTAKSMGWQ